MGRGLLACAVLIWIAAPASAQTELAGSWVARNHEDALERGQGPYAVDYTGIPLNGDGRDRALSSSAALLGMIERQCEPYPPHFLAIGPFGLRISNETDPVTRTIIAWKIASSEALGETTIWMDGRPHPSPNAPHPRGGFTTGVWDGDTLVTYTTHMRAGVIRRNGAPNSDRATMTSYLFRYGDLLTLLGVIEDPVFLAEPYIISRSFQLDSNPLRAGAPPCVPGYEGQSGNGEVPHYLPGTNPWVDELTKLYHIPREAILGGPHTMYPEFRETIMDQYSRPEKCIRNCERPPAP